MNADRFLDACRAAGVDLFTGTPCSYLGGLLRRLELGPDPNWYPAPNEGDAVAFAAGAHIGGRTPLVLFQNSGLGNAVNALTSLCDPFRIPMVLLVSHRGDPGSDPTSDPDEPQHRLMGRITHPLLELMEIGHEVLPADDAGAAEAIARAVGMAERDERPYALTVPKGTFGGVEAGGEAEGDAEAGDRGPGYARRRSAGAEATEVEESGPNPAGPERDREILPTRADVIDAVLRAERPGDLIVATTGYTGRELHDRSDGPNRLYMVGSMGSASALGLGLAVARPDRRVIVLDGDGALLMRMGNLAFVGAFAPESFVHILLDNGVHESTGGQRTVGVDFAGVARGCGYGAVERMVDARRLTELVSGSSAGPHFVHVRTRADTDEKPGRPALEPFQLKRRLMEGLSFRA